MIAGLARKAVTTGPGGCVTESVVVEVADFEFASVTVTVVEKLPAAVGVQFRVAELAVVHPVGSPA
jgi:hypothetical protein